MHAALKIRKDAAAARDARTYFRAAGGGEKSAPYTALAAAVADWRLGRPADPSAIVAEARRVVKADTWLGALLQFAAGELPADKLVAHAKEDGQRTEAHAYARIKMAAEGKRDEALVHLRWVKERGNKNYAEYDWALSELKRLEGTP